MSGKTDESMKYLNRYPFMSGKTDESMKGEAGWQRITDWKWLESANPSLASKRSIKSI
jgi:hypothetical protein